MHNLIETISAGMFFAASACEILNLSYNSIHSIEADAFQVIRRNFCKTPRRSQNLLNFMQGVIDLYNHIPAIMYF